MKIATTLAIVALCFCSLHAQRGYEVGGWIGVSQYFGDLNDNFGLNRPGIAAGVIGRYNFNTRLSIRASGNYTRVSAYDSDSNNEFQLARNLSFRSNIIEGLAQFEFNFLPYVHGSDDEFFTPYLFGGLTFAYFNPQAEIDDAWVDLQPLGTEGQPIGGEYNKVAMGFVYGAGVKIDLSYYWSLNIELSARSLFTDYLDDVSTEYPNAVELQALRGDLSARLSDRSLEVRPEAIGEAGRQRGTSTSNDGFALLSIGLVYYIGTLECPPISRPR